MFNKLTPSKKLAVKFAYHILTSDVDLSKVADTELAELSETLEESKTAVSSMQSHIKGLDEKDPIYQTLKLGLASLEEKATLYANRVEEYDTDAAKLDHLAELLAEYDDSGDGNDDTPKVVWPEDTPYFVEYGGYRHELRKVIKKVLPTERGSRTGIKVVLGIGRGLPENIRNDAGLEESSAVLMAYHKDWSKAEIVRSIPGEHYTPTSVVAAIIKSVGKSTNSGVNSSGWKKDSNKAVYTSEELGFPWPEPTEQAADETESK